MNRTILRAGLRAITPAPLYRGLALLGLALTTVALVALGSAPAAGAAARPSIGVRHAVLMKPAFNPRKHDYAVRCKRGTKVRVTGAKGWRTRIDSGPFLPGGVTRTLSRSGRSRDVTFRRAGRERVRSYHLRCLPKDFPDYSFDRQAPGGPKLFAIQLPNRYAAIFNGDGVPVWWYKTTGQPDNAQVLPDGTVAFDPVDRLTFQTGEYQIRSLSGRLIRVVRGKGGAKADIHEIQLMPNGNYLIGSQKRYEGIDTTQYGGSPDSTVIGIEIQEVTPDGRLVWHWDSTGHIGLAETGRWWDMDILNSPPYDVVHWNSAELVGKHRLLLSFRHLDAIYEIDRRTGKIRWKLGGTRTPESLRVLGDDPYPLGGQHDARVLADGTITVYDNATGLGTPRALHYEVDDRAGTARLIDSIAEPEVTSSFCCGSYRQLDDGRSLIAWGPTGLIGAYDARGRRIFALRLLTGFTYRANPVPEGVVTTAKLRRKLDRLLSRKR